MKYVFKPAISLMNQLSYSKKLVLLAIIVVSIIIFLVHQLVSQSNSIIDFSQKEIVGVNYINPLIKVMDTLKTYRSTAESMLLKNAIDKNKLVQLMNDIDSAVRHADTSDSKLGASLDITNNWLDIKNQWAAIKGNISQNVSKENLTQITVLIAGLNKLVITACDNSNLTLDPDIDTYYLMDSYCTKIPMASEQAYQIRDTGMQALITKSLSTAKHEEVIINSALLFQFSLVGIKI